jgi:molybdopterin-guanine dinucleotide biosynthesis protein A
LDRSVIILAVDSGNKFGEEKALLKLDGKPLLNHVVDAVKGIVGEVLVVSPSKEQAEHYGEVISSANVQLAVIEGEPQGDLAAALTGFEAARSDYSLVLPCDAPFVSKEVISLLFELSASKSAVVPRWPDCRIEPLHAVYHTGQACEATKKALAAGEAGAEAIAGCMRGVRYVSTMVVEQLDPDFRTFFRVRTPLDLKKAASLLKPKRKQ